MGNPIFRFIPMKVPLAPRFDTIVKPEDRFTVEDAMKMAKEKIAGITMKLPGPDDEKTGAPTTVDVPAICNLVIDLTNSSRYYRRETFEEEGFFHAKVSYPLESFHFLKNKPSLL